MAKEIALINGKGVALVDDEDFCIAAKFRWYRAQARPNAPIYAVAEYTDPKLGRRRLRLHRLIMEAPPGHLIDHINGNGLDNRRSNLRIATARENIAAAKYPRVERRGVYNARGGFMARITIRPELRYLGTFSSEFLAAVAYDAMALAEFGEFATLNYPELRIALTKAFNAYQRKQGRE